MAAKQIVYFLHSTYGADVQNKGFVGINYCFRKLSEFRLVSSRVHAETPRLGSGAWQGLN